MLCFYLWLYYVAFCKLIKLVILDSIRLCILQHPLAVGIRLTTSEWSTFTTLWADLADDKFMIFCPENRIWYFMQTVKVYFLGQKRQLAWIVNAYFLGI